MLSVIILDAIMLPMFVMAGLAKENLLRRKDQYRLSPYTN